ncbi:hypothetical protein [Treponema pedis]|uniref:hypothetical protein n=1 Tax=Treponema pedis TaxID=409322 RepID=UPI000412D0D5|nr:hypothetical protein [Treponema pedis]
MKKKLFSKILLIFFSVLFMQFFSCTGKEKSSAPLNEKIKPKRIIRDKILLILGKDYYEKNGILGYLKEEYGIGNEESPVKLLTYKDMTETTKLPRLKMITEKIEEYKITIVISIGIPEGGGRYLIQNAENNPLITIISLLPMDEILPLEAASDIVIDFKAPTSLLNKEDSFTVSDDDIGVLLTASVFAGEDINAKNKNLKNSPLEEFREALFTAQKVMQKPVFNNDYSIKPFIDSDTGIPSHKYLLIYKNGENPENDLETPDSKDTEDAVDENGDITNPDKLEGGA